MKLDTNREIGEPQGYEVPCVCIIVDLYLLVTPDFYSKKSTLFEFLLQNLQKLIANRT